MGWRCKQYIQRHFSPTRVSKCCCSEGESINLPTPSAPLFPTLKRVIARCHGIITNCHTQSPSQTQSMQRALHYRRLREGKGEKKVVCINYELAQTHVGVLMLTALTELFYSVYTSANIWWKTLKTQNESNSFCMWVVLIAFPELCVCVRACVKMCVSTSLLNGCRMPAQNNGSAAGVIFGYSALLT